MTYYCVMTHYRRINRVLRVFHTSSEANQWISTFLTLSNGRSDGWIEEIDISDRAVIDLES